MPNRLTILFVLLFCPLLCFQQETEAGALLKKGNEMLYNDPRQAIKIGENLLRNPDTQLKADAATLLAKGHFVTGHYSEALANAQLALAESRKAGKPEAVFASLLLAAEMYTGLELFALSEKLVAEAQAIAESHVVLKKQLEAYLLFVATRTPNFTACSRCTKGMSVADMGANAFISKGMPLLLTAAAFQGAKQMDSAALYLEENAKDVIENRRGAYWQILALIGYSDYHFARKDYPAAATMLEEALQKEKTIGNLALEKTINEKRALVALAMGNKKQFQALRKKAEAAQDDLDSQVTQATNAAFETLQSEKTRKVEQAEKRSNKITMALGMAILLLLLAWLVVRWLFNAKKRHLQDVISYLKLIRNIERKPEPVGKPAAKNLSIPKETEDLILSKLEKFEAGKKYLGKDFSLAQLAALLDTNTKYLSEVINKYKRKNFNSYTNELRIGYIVEKLKNDPKYLNYKVSYLAEECGFSSHSQFSAAFKGTTGLTPNVFIQFLSEDVHLAEKQPKLRQP